MKSKRCYSTVLVGSAALFSFCGFATHSYGTDTDVSQTNSTAVSHQPEPSLPPGTSTESLHDFESAFSALSEQRHITLLFEGVPLRQTLSSDEVERLEKTISGSPDISVETLVSEMALAFDYNSMPFGHGVYVLQKRYSDTNDLPCVSYEEIVRSLTSVLSVAERLSPVPRDAYGSGYPPFNFYDALTPDQITRGATSGLCINDLDSSQRLLALGAAREAVLDRRIGNLKDVLAQIRKLRDTRTLFSWVNAGKTSVFACRGPFGPNDEMLAIPLSGEVDNSSGANVDAARPAGRIFDVRGPSGAVVSQSAGTAVEFQMPGAVDRLLAPGMLSQKLPSTLTLRELESAISQISADGGIPVSFDDALADKPVCLFGGQFCAGRLLARAVAKVYDLAVFSGDRFSLKIGLPKPRPPQSAEDYGPEFARLTPSPLLRYISAHAENDYTPTPGGGINRKMFTVSSSMQAHEAWYGPVNRRTVILSEPAVPALTSPPVVVDSLGAEPERLLALMLLSRPAMGQLRNLANFIPPQFLIDPDQMTIVISMSTSRSYKTLRVEFGYRDATGAVQPESRNSYMTMIPH